MEGLSSWGLPTGALVATGVALVASIALLNTLRRSAAPSGKLRRSMSFTSAACAEGAFPAHSAMPPPIIHAVILLKGAPLRSDVEETVELLLKFERFRSRKVKVGGEWYFEELDDVKASDHVFEESFSGGEDELFKRMETMSLELLHVADDRPPFELVVVKNTGSGPSAVVARINHAIGDGISLAKLIQVVFKDINGKPVPPPERFTRREKDFKPSLSDPISILGSLFKVLSIPSSPYDTEIGLLGPDRKHIKNSGHRIIVRFPVIKLPFIKALKNAAHVTLNDVIYAATAGAIHRFREAAKDPVLLDPDSGKKVQTRVLLPVAIPRSDDDPVRALRNKWSFASVSMPIGTKGSLERLTESNQTLGHLKNSPIIIVSNTFENMLGRRLPWNVSKQVAFDTFTRHTMVFSNVPGPDTPLTFAGKEVTGLYMVYANLIPQFGALSMNGKLYMCIVLDGAVVKGADEISKHFIEELKDLARRLNIPFSDADIFA